mgnify:CR=1 FL=1
MTNEAHSAEDVSQAVFVALAKNAARVARNPVLQGWLRNLAAKTVRAAVRRQFYEREAVDMNQLICDGNKVTWELVPRTWTPAWAT